MWIFNNLPRIALVLLKFHAMGEICPAWGSRWKWKMAAGGQHLCWGLTACHHRMWGTRSPFPVVLCVGEFRRVARELHVEGWRRSLCGDHYLKPWLAGHSWGKEGNIFWKFQVSGHMASLSQTLSWHTQGLLAFSFLLPCDSPGNLKWLILKKLKQFVENAVTLNFAAHAGQCKW